MSDDSKPGESPTSIRALLLDPETLTGPRVPSVPAGAFARIYGAEFVGWDARVDLAIVLAPVREMGLRNHVLKSVNLAANAPTSQTILAARRVILREAEWRDSAEHAPRLKTIAAALPYHSAALGCAQSSASIAARSLEMAQADFMLGRTGPGWFALRAALLWSSDAQVDCSDAPYMPAPLYSRLAEYDTRASAWASGFTAIAQAEAMVSMEDDILRGGAGMTAPRDFDLEKEFGEDLIARARPYVAPAGLVVVGSLGHLPKPSIGSQDRKDSPRSEFDPIAEKHLKLTPAPDPRAFVQAGLARFPWAEDVLTTIAHDLVGAPYAWIRPTLLLGGAGSGKTALARWISNALGLDATVYSVTATMDGSFAGTSRQWGTGRASVPLQAIRRAGHATVLVVLDEVEKGTNDRRHGRLDEAILPFLERESSRRVFDPYLECGVDLSAVSYVATANDLNGVASPLRDRFRVIQMPVPRRQDLTIVAANLVAEVRTDRGLGPEWLPDLAPDELALLAKHFRGGSLRPLRRLVEAVLAGRESFATRN